MALSKSEKGKKKLVKADKNPHVKAKRVHAPKSAPAKAPDDNMAKNFRTQGKIEESEGAGSPSTRRRKKLRESPLKVLQKSIVSASRGGRGGGRGRGRGTRVKNAIAEVLAMADALKAAGGDGANAEALVAHTAESENRVGVKSNVQAVYTPPHSPSNGVHINFYLPPNSPLLPDTQIVTSRILRSESNSGVVTGTPVKSPLPPCCLIPPVSPSVAQPQPPFTAPCDVPPRDSST